MRRAACERARQSKASDAALRRAAPALFYRTFLNHFALRAPPRGVRCSCLPAHDLRLTYEAAASVDNATDAFVQTMLRRDFARATTLTIAHRLSSVLDSDRVLVLRAGEVAEFGAPAELLAAPGGLFATMHAESNAEHSAEHTATAE